MFNFVNRSNFIIRVLNSSGVIVFSSLPKTNVEFCCVSTSSSAGIWANVGDVQSNILTRTNTFIGTTSDSIQTATIVNLNTTQWVYINATFIKVFTLNLSTGAITETATLNHSRSVSYPRGVLIGTNKVLLAANSVSISTAFVITVSGSTITLGASFTFASVAQNQWYNSQSTLAYVDVDKAVISYTGDNNNLFAQLLIVSGTTVSFGGGVQTSSQALFGSVSTIGTNKILATYPQSTNGSYLVRILTVSGTSLTQSSGNIYWLYTNTNSMRASSSGYLSGSVGVLIDSSTTVGRMLSINFIGTSGSNPTSLGSLVIPAFDEIVSVTGNTVQLSVDKVSDNICLITAVSNGIYHNMFLIDVSKMELISRKALYLGGVGGVTVGNQNPISSNSEGVVLFKPNDQIYLNSLKVF
jgi:hypothetical protein